MDHQMAPVPDPVSGGASDTVGGTVMAVRIPIAAAKRIAQEFSQRQVILTTWGEDGVTHVVTYGKSVLDCEQAAMGGNKIKAALGWPDHMCQAKPARSKSR